MAHTWLHRYSILLAVCTFFLVIAGASVTSNNAGLAVPDWPLSFGRLMPEMKGGVFFEHGHRMVATLVGILTIGLVIFLWKADERRWLRWLGLGGLLLVILQGVLGGITVLHGLPKSISILHACMAQLYFSLTVCVALFTSHSWQREPPAIQDMGWPPIRGLTLVVSLSVLAQLALGAAYRHMALGLMPHIMGALVVTALVLWLVLIVLTQHRANAALVKAAKRLLIVTLHQVPIGVLAYFLRISIKGGSRFVPLAVYTTVIHVAVGALLMAASVVVAIQVWRSVRAPSPLR